MGAPGSYLIREFDRQRDAGEVQQLDTSYTTETVYAVTAEDSAVRLARVRLPSDQQGRFAIDLDEPRWDQGFVAVERGKIRGFIATRFDAWNRRLAIWHFYVDRNQRRLGIGRALMDRAIEVARELGALTIWAETSNVNTPGIDAYQGLGFSICGFDLTLYRGTTSGDQFAIYLARPLV